MFLGEGRRGGLDNGIFFLFHFSTLWWFNIPSYNFEEVSFAGGQDACEEFVVGFLRVFLFGLVGLDIFYAFGAFVGNWIILNGWTVTFLKSAIWAAYWDGVRIRLGTSLASPALPWPCRCSSLMNLFISNNRKESIYICLYLPSTSPSLPLSSSLFSFRITDQYTNVAGSIGGLAGDNNGWCFGWYIISHMIGKEERIF